MKKNERFEVLDGLRGVAALAVLLLHITPGFAVNIVPHAALAVDFFFALSGFVIAAAYSRRLEMTMSVGAFMCLRVIRLYPLIVVGAIFGMIGYFKIYSHSTLTFLFVTGLLLIPTPFGAKSEAQTLIPINPASWSLLWEIVVNLLFALIIKKLTNRVLIAIVISSAIALIASGSPENGLNIGSFWHDGWAGAPRVVFSFFAGVALFRLRSAGKLARFDVPGFPIAAALCIILMVPLLGAWNIVFDAVSVLILFPLIIAAGSNAEPRRWAKLCRFCGEISYPAYILQGGITPHLRGLPGHLHLTGFAATGVSIVLAAIFVIFSWIVLKLFDEPVRAWLLNRRKDVHKGAATAP